MSAKSGKRPSPERPAIGAFRRRHLALAERPVVTRLGRARVLVDTQESPLQWLASRRSRDGRPLIAPHQFAAGERLRGDFTRAQLMPRMTADWSRPVAGGAGECFSDAVVGARQRMQRALDAVGPEFAGLLVDVCCFLKRLEDVERERAWPLRSAKVVLQLGLDRLARHYGYDAEARGPARQHLRRWHEAEN